VTPRWRQPISLAEALKKALDQWNLTKDMKRHEVLSNWESIAGAQIAERSKPLKIQGHQLIVEVDHPTWIQELTMLKSHLLSKIAQSYPQSRIKNIRFVLK
jgi:predicted nucleic acid-binding Zn ribbon protein